MTVAKPELKQNPHAVHDAGSGKWRPPSGARTAPASAHDRGRTRDPDRAFSGYAVEDREQAISPSLSTLQTLAHAFRIPLVQLFSGYTRSRRGRCTSRPAMPSRSNAPARGQGISIIFSTISARTDSGVVVRPYLIVLNNESDRFPTFQHGHRTALHARRLRRLSSRRSGLSSGAGADSFIFDADAPHGPEKLVTLPTRYLSIITYPQAK